MSELQATSEPRRVCLGMPGHGNCTAGAARGLWNASVFQTNLDKSLVRWWHPLDVAVTYLQGSLLAQQFNALWCWALNASQQQEISYFAMLHSDIEPEDYWLDKLIAEMEAKELDLLGVVVPIKDPHGMTSIALDRDDHDTWRPLCRLSMKEVFNLPETFTSEDVGHDLLLNTGCWVFRFDPAVARQLNFTVNDRIVFNQALGIYQAQVEPEDWYFSRLCHEQGLRIGATRKVGLHHVGPHAFTNRSPWGEDFDMKYVPESVIPTQQKSDWTFPHDVDGWLSWEEGEALAELAKDKTVLEIGSYCGRSTICMAQTAKVVHWIDPHDGRGTQKPRDTRLEFEDNLKRYGVVDKCGEYGDAQETKYDLTFIDGAHDYASVSADIDYAMIDVADDGLIAFHDYRPAPGVHDGGWDAEVTKAVNEFIDDGAELLAVHGTIAVVKPPACVPAMA